MSIYKQVKSEAKGDLVSQFTAILSALLPVLAILGINLEWFNSEFIDSLGILLSAVIFFGVNVFGIWKNHYSGKRAREQNKALKEKGLK